MIRAAASLALPRSAAPPPSWSINLAPPMTGAGKPVPRIGPPSLARLARRENGTAAIELALLAPLLVLLLLNLVDFSLMIWSYMEADYSAQMGVRAAYATCAGVALRRWPTARASMPRWRRP